MKSKLQVETMFHKFTLRILSITSAFGLGLIPAIASAHVNAGETSGFLHGLDHPIGGLDHILAMVAVGLWAAQLGGQAIWSIPLTFVGVMAVGGALGISGVTLPFVEQGIIASDLILGGLVLMATRLPLAASISIVGILAIFHGYAHGAEMPKDISGLEYAAGFMLATIGLHLVGMTAGTLAQKFFNERLIRYAGGGIIVGGLYVLFGALTRS